MADSKGSAGIKIPQWGYDMLVTDADKKEALRIYQASSDDGSSAKWIETNIPSAEELVAEHIIREIANFEGIDKGAEGAFRSYLCSKGYGKSSFINASRANSVRIRLSRKGYNAVCIEKDGKFEVAAALPKYMRADIKDKDTAAVLFP